MNEYRSGTDSLVMKLLIAHGIFFLVQMFAGQNIESMMIYFLGLRPAAVIHNGYIWQLVTYMFPHGDGFHFFFNMYAVMLFGMSVEQTWGSKKFLGYYFFTGIGAGISIFIINYFIIGGYAAVNPTIGASGAVFGLLLAFGILFPDAQLLLFFVLPIRAKYLVVLYGGIELYLMISSGGGGGISHVGHLGGILFGGIYFLVFGKGRQGIKARRFKEKLKNEIQKRETQIRPVQKTGNPLLDILKKVRTRGVDALSDDEYQQVKYKMIMLEEAEGLCVDEDFNIEDAYCQKCDNVEACILRELKKYIK